MEGKHGWSWTYFKLAFIVGILRLLFTPFLFIADLFPKRLPPGIVKETIKVPSRDVGRFIKVHIYKPLQQNPSNYQVLLPVHLNFFGSGYLFDTHGKDWKFCSYFAKRLNMIVLDCDYRTFPHAFPSAYNDCVDLVKWCSSRTDRGWDVNKISIAGRSSGGNLALSVSSTFPDLIKSVVSLYPPTDFRISATDERFLKSPSQVSRAGMPLTRSMLKLCDQAYVLPGIDREDPRLSVIFGKASSFPQHVWVACGNADILYNDSKQFISNLQRDGHPNAVLMSVENEGHAWDELAKKGSVSEERKNEAYDAICRTIQSGWTDSRGKENHKTDEE